MRTAHVQAASAVVVEVADVAQVVVATVVDDHHAVVTPVVVDATK